MKIFLITVVIAILSMSSAMVEAEACCPDSTYSIETVTTKYPGTSCDMDVVFCYKELLNGTRVAKLCEVIFDMNSCGNVNVVFDQDFFMYLDTIMLSEIHTINSLAPCLPDGSSTEVAEIKKSSCYEVIDDPIQQISILAACGSGSADCVTFYDVCIDNGEIKKTRTYGPAKVGLDACPPPGENPPDIYINTCFSSCY